MRIRNAEKIFFCLAILILIYLFAYAPAQPLQLQLTTDKTEIFTTEFPVYTVKVTNTGTAEIKIIDTDYKGADQQWVIDNPRVALAGAVYVGDRWQIQGQHKLKPGESFTDQPRIYFPERATNSSWETNVPQPITLRVGLRTAPDAQPIWSNPVTISFKTYKDLQAKEKISFEEINIDAWCYPIFEHIKEVSPFAISPIFESQLVINDQQTYEQFMPIRRGIPGRDCHQDFGKCLNDIWKKAGHDEQEYSRLLKTLCVPPNETQGCDENQACLTKELPSVDFTKKTVLGQATEGTCGTTGYKKEVFRDDQAKIVTYFVTAINAAISCSGSGAAGLNLIAVPKIPNDYKVVFSYKFL